MAALFQMSYNMKRLKYNLINILVIISCHGLFAQDEKPLKTDFNGYVKYMQAWDVTHGLDSVLDNHLLHNRLNFSWFPKEEWTLRVEMRNRIFIGDYVRRIPFYGEFVDVYNDQFDMSVWVVNNNSIKMLSEIDRAYVQYVKDSWEFTAGRQRINWGINTVWNPNDIFNAYSFFDFDYEERPGSDAVNVTYYYSFASSISFASKITDNPEDYTGAMLWKFNKSGYDFQLLSGVMQNNAVIGTGWAGNIRTAGFKGEASYFHGLESGINNSFVGSISGDYVYGKTYFLLSYFYNSAGVKEPDATANLALVSAIKPLNAKNLLPFPHAIITQVSSQLNPLLNASLAVMYFPDVEGAYFGPSLSYSASDNISVDLISQIFTIGDDNIFNPTSSQVFLRGKWSF